MNGMLDSKEPFLQDGYKGKKYDHTKYDLFKSTVCANTALGYNNIQFNVMKIYFFTEF